MTELVKFKQFFGEDFNQALVEPSSAAAAQAKKLGLQYVGFGRYEDPNTQQVTHIVQNERLVPFSKAIKSNAFKQQSADDYGSMVKQQLPQIEQVHTYLSSYYKPESYTEDELDAIQEFTGPGYLDINEKLYSLPTGIKANKIEPEFDGDEIPAHVAALDTALNKTKCPVETLVYVGLGPEYDITQFVPGKSFSFKGFRSTTLNPNIALNYNSRVNKTAQRQQTVMLQIKVKKGSKGMFVDDFSANPGESEYLLPRGSKVKILSGPNKLVGSNAYTGSNGLEVLYYDCELVK
jgi:hypothetical protein